MGALRFRLFGFPTEVHPGFIFLVVVFGLYLGQESWLHGVSVSLAIVSAVVAHELGHAVTARLFGQKPHIVLHMLGGLTAWSGRRLGRGAEVLVSLAGPGAGLGLGVVGGVLLQLVVPDLPAPQTGADGAESTPALPVTGFALLWFTVANIVLAVINLVPVLPFDGGRILAAALGPKRNHLAATISLIVGLSLAAVFIVNREVTLAFLFGLAAVISFASASRRRQLEAAATGAEATAALTAPLERARSALTSEDFAQAAALAQAVHEMATRPADKREALEILAWSALAAGDPGSARELLRQVPESEPVDAYLAGVVHQATDHLDQAQSVLERARGDGDSRPELAALLVRVYLAREQWGRAAELVSKILTEVPPEEVRQVIEEAAAGGSTGPAARLAEELFVRSGGFQDGLRAAELYALDQQPEAALRCLSQACAGPDGDAERARCSPALSPLADDPNFERAISGRPLAASDGPAGKRP